MVTTFYPPFNFGGDGITVRRLANALAEAGHHVEIAHCVDAFDMLRPAGVPAGGEYDDHPAIVHHPLRSRAGRLSPLITQQTGAPDGGVTVILNMSIGPGANQFKVQVVVLSVGGGRPLQGVIVTLLTTAGRIAPPRGSTDVAGIFNAILTCDDSGAASIVTAAAEGVVVQDTRCGTPAPPVTSGEPEPNPLTPPAKS